MGVIGNPLDRICARAVSAWMPTEWNRDHPGAYWPLRLIWAWRLLLDPDLLTSFIRSGTVPHVREGWTDSTPSTAGENCRMSRQAVTTGLPDISSVADDAA
jgi:hypothetical protein